MTAAADQDEARARAQRLGLEEGLTVQEIGWDEDIDDALRSGIEAVIGGMPGVATVGGVTFPVSTVAISGNFFITVTFGTGANGAVQSVTVKWYVATTGVEVTTVSNTDLSAEKVRLFLLGV